MKSKILLIVVVVTLNFKPARRRLILLLLAGGLQTLNCFSQDIHFSQHYANPLNMNPALAGSLNEDIKAILTYKDQWSQLDNPYKTYSLCADAGFLKQKNKNGYLGAGINLFYDISGISKLSTTTLNLTGSYHVKLNMQNWLTAGLQGGILQRKINDGDLQWDNQYDGTGYNPSLSSGETYATEPFMLGDVSTGLVWNYQSEKAIHRINNEGIKSELGVAFFHVNKPQYSFYSASKDRIYARYVVHGKVSVEIPNSIFALIPTFVYMKQGPSTEFISGTYLRMMLKDYSSHTGLFYASALSLGAHWRLKDAVALALLFEMHRVALGLSYDINISGLKYATNKNGGLEVTLRYCAPNPFAYRRKGSRLL
ncbi:MAG: PorP/SprF family type IX secretion system membrane protein [Bacteroidia bacterium]|nr:PorP/SprF family type IX secretion system membrane protein [Bacteroidia bacterium]